MSRLMEKLPKSNYTTKQEVTDRDLLPKLEEKKVHYLLNSRLIKYFQFTFAKTVGILGIWIGTRYKTPSNLDKLHRV